jgi:hypothetical protein
MEDNFSGGRPFHIFVDGGNAGKKLEEALTNVGGPAIEIVKHADDARGFVFAARRWVVERKLAWVKRYWRHVKDLEATIAPSEASLIITSILQPSGRIARNLRLANLTQTSAPALTKPFLFGQGRQDASLLGGMIF